MKAYLKLAEKFDTIYKLNSANAILGWDNAVIMPSGSAESRAEEMATLSAIAHQIITSPDISDLLDEAELGVADYDNWQRRNLELMRHEWLHANAIDEKLLKEFSITGSKCEHHWRQAREDNDFKTYAHFQKPVLELARNIATLKSEKLGLSLYESLLDKYDAGRRVSEIDSIFNELECFLPDFIQEVVEKQNHHSKPIKPNPPFSVEKQKELGIYFMKKIGFDFDKGRLDTSSHPFCGGTSDDIRITTRYDESDFTGSLMGVLHETGHAMYDGGLPYQYRGQPVGDSLGMTIHESQSLLMEMQVCRSKAFVKFALPKIIEIFGDQPAFEFNNFYTLYNQVKPSLIRVDADEVTYPLHVIIRYKLEKAMISGELEVDDLPDAWNLMYKELLGVDVPDYKNGCLQDIHWSDGSYGYFPTYTLGAMYAAQFYNAYKQHNTSSDRQIEQGNFNFLISWLRENIHSQGSLYNSNALLERVTGKSLSVDIYKNYLKNKYLNVI